MQFSEVEQFAAYLRMLKDRSGRGFERLGKQAGVSSSSLHRYCSGSSVPPDYRVVHSFAKACGASSEELRALHRLWAVADTNREALAAVGRGPGEGGPETSREPVTEPVSPAAAAAGQSVSQPVSQFVSQFVNRSAGATEAIAPPVNGAVRTGVAGSVATASGAVGTRQLDPRDHQPRDHQPRDHQTDDPRRDHGPLDHQPGGQQPGDHWDRQDRDVRDRDVSDREVRDRELAVEPRRGHEVDTRRPGTRERVDTVLATGPGPAPEPPNRLRVPSGAATVLAVAVTAVAVTAMITVLVQLRPGAAAAPNDQHELRLLFTDACSPQVSMGQHDDCVQEVQNLLSQAGGKLAVDGDFGPETLRRVTAFQVLAGLPARGVVDEDTKRALYAGRVSLGTWTQQQVERQIRATFKEDPEHALAVARCQSHLDPLHITPNTNGSRNWGVFQISDGRLQDYGGSPAVALDPAWNIETAHKLWAVQHDFHDWPYCDAAWNGTPSPGPSAGSSAPSTASPAPTG